MNGIIASMTPSVYSPINGIIASMIPSIYSPMNGIIASMTPEGSLSISSNIKSDLWHSVTFSLIQFCRLD